MILQDSAKFHFLEVELIAVFNCLRFADVPRDIVFRVLASRLKHWDVDIENFLQKTLRSERSMRTDYARYSLAAGMPITHVMKEYNMSQATVYKMQKELPEFARISSLEGFFRMYPKAVPRLLELVKHFKRFNGYYFADRNVDSEILKYFQGGN